MPSQARTTKQGRKHVTTACIPCRQGKVKCDGTIPKCKNCDYKGRECSYRQRFDKRKIPIRIAVNILAKRVNILCNYISDCGLPIPELGNQDSETLQKVCLALGLSCDGLTDESDYALAIEGQISNDTTIPDLKIPDAVGNCNPTQGNYGDGVGTLPLSQKVETPREQPQQATDVDLMFGMNVEQPVPNPPDSNLVSSSLNGNQPPIKTNIQSSPDESIHEEGWDSDSDDEVTTLLSYRLGRLQLTGNGQLRYFGSTSNLNLLDAHVTINIPKTTAARRSMDASFEIGDLRTKVDEGLERHLIELYFAWQDPSLGIVNEEIFWKARLQNFSDGLSTPYYSEALCSAMCSLGAAYEPKHHSQFVTFPRSLGEFFSDKAKALLDIELENPSLATIQTLVVLSSYEASLTNDTRGWLYSGMASRLSFDLGLHLNMTSYVMEGVISQEECQARRTIFWAVYIHEQFWGYYLGRPVRTPTAGVTVQKPAAEFPLPTNKWRPYGLTGQIVGQNEDMTNPMCCIFQKLFELSDIMVPLTDVLYGCAEISNHILQDLTEMTVDRLTTWKQALPVELGVCATREPKQYLPSVLLLHMQYHQFMIFCHRPYISKSYIQPQPPQGPGPFHARRKCIESAIAIAETLTIWEKRYSFRRANAQTVSYIFSAALILIFATTPKHTGNQDRELIKHLSTCFRALDEMASCFKNAERTSTFLATLRREWRRRRAENTLHSMQARASNNPSSNNGHSTTLGDMIPYSASEQDRQMESFYVPSDLFGQPCSFVPMGPPHDVDFMYPDVCNVLLSEGMPRTSA